MGNVILCGQRCVIAHIQRHAASPIMLMDILSHDQLRLVKERQFPWTPKVFFPLFFVARQKVENILVLFSIYKVNQ